MQSRKEWQTSVPRADFPLHPFWVLSNLRNYSSTAWRWSKTGSFLYLLYVCIDRWLKIQREEPVTKTKEAANLYPESSFSTSQRRRSRNFASLVQLFPLWLQFHRSRAGFTSRSSERHVNTFQISRWFEGSCHFLLAICLRSGIRWTIQCFSRWTKIWVSKKGKKSIKPRNRKKENGFDLQWWSVSRSNAAKLDETEPYSNAFGRLYAWSWSSGVYS